jgi:N-acyl homoserine lactone hydrolase
MTEPAHADAVHLLALGTLTAPRAILHVGGTGTVDLPIPAFLILTGDRRIVVDSGMSELVATDPEAAWNARLAGRYTPHIGPDDTMAARLAQHGLEPEDITDLVLTHLHFDHSGGMDLLPAATRWVQRREYRTALNPDRPEGGGYLPHTLGGEYELLDGDATIAPGVHVICTDGHSAGHQSVLVHTPGRWTCLVGDAADTREILDQALMPGVVVDPSEALRAMARLRMLETALGAQLIFSHDGEQHAALPDPLA